MELNIIELTITDEDLASLVGKYALPEDAPVKDLAARIDEGGVTVSGKFHAGILKGAFDACISLQVDGRIVVATLTELKALGPVGGMLKGVLMTKLQEKVSDVPGVSSDEDTIRIDIAELMATKGIAMKIETLEIGFAAGKCMLKLSGSMDCAM